MTDQIPKMPSISSNVIKAQKIYDDLGAEFIKQNNGKYISVDPDSGTYFVGETREEAVEKANEALGNEKIVFTRRIGTLEKVAFHSPLQFGRGEYACLF